MIKFLKTTFCFLLVFFIFSSDTIADVAPEHRKECKPPCCVENLGIPINVCHRIETTCRFTVSIICKSLGVEYLDVTHLCIEHNWNLALCMSEQPVRGAYNECEVDNFQETCENSYLGGLSSSGSYCGECQMAYRNECASGTIICKVEMHGK